MTLAFIGVFSAALLCVRVNCLASDVYNDKTINIIDILRGRFPLVHQDNLAYTNQDKTKYIYQENEYKENLYFPLVPPKWERKVWSLGIGRSFSPLELLDEDTMEVQGLAVDMMRAACRVANQDCVFVNYARYTYCWEDSTQRSDALDNRWFDACVSWLPTPERALSYSFAPAFAMAHEITMYAKQNDDIKFKDLSDEDNEIAIGFFSGSWMNEACLSRSGAFVNSKLTRGYGNYPQMFDALRRGEVRVIFAGRQNVDKKFREVDLGDTKLTCTNGGHGVMTRKNNVELLSWLGPAIETVMRSPEYPRMCYIWSQIFGQDTRCLDKATDESQDEYYKW